MKLIPFSTLVLMTAGVSLASAQDIFNLDELSLKNQISKDVPEIQKIESAFFSAAHNEFREKDILTPEVFAKYQDAKTNERAIISFMPVWSPVVQYEVGVRKNFSTGISASLSSAVDTRSASLNGLSGPTTYDKVTTVIHSLNVSIDMWKDLFGKLTSAKIESAELSKKSSELQKEIQKKAFYVALRRVYWSLVANNEKLKISKELLKTAQEQAIDAKKRQANNIADVGEVARYESQVYSRQSSILYLEYQKEAYLKQLRTLLPSLANKKIEFSDYNLDKTIFDVLKCTNLIASNNGVPLDYTSYDEIVNILKVVESKQHLIDQSYDNLDLKLNATYKLTGVGSDAITASSYEGSISKANDDISNNDRSGFAIGAALTIPLGSNKTQAKDSKVIYNQMKLQAQRTELNSNLTNTHEQVLKSIDVLTKVVQVQKLNSQKLSIRLKDMQKKYNQARISVSDLIQDQDAKMNSDLAVIDTQLAAVNTLLDYFIVFSETPCGFNRI